MQTMMTFGLFLSFGALCLNPKCTYKNCVAITCMYVYSIMHTKIYYLIAYSSARSSEKGDLCWMKCSSEMLQNLSLFGKKTPVLGDSTVFHKKNFFTNEFSGIRREKTFVIFFLKSNLTNLKAFHGNISSSIYLYISEECEDNKF